MELQARIDAICAGAVARKATNKKATQEYYRAHYRANREEYRAAQVRFAKKNPERARQIKRATWARMSPERRAERNVRRRAWANENKETVAEHNERNRLKRYGLTPEQYKALLASQGGCCAICSADEPGRGYRWRIDHCHETKVVRGLLCNKCNLMLGLAKDRTNVLTKAVEYLEKT